MAHLERAKALGLRNILALRGDLSDPNPDLSKYKYKAVDLVRWIRETYGNYFTIAVAGECECKNDILSTMSPQRLSAWSSRCRLLHGRLGKS